MQKIKALWAGYKADRRRQRFLAEKFEALTDPTFLDRALADDFELPKYNAIYGGAN